MKTIEIQLYNYEELSPEAKKRAHNEWNKDADFPFLTEELTEMLYAELEERGIEYDRDSIKVYYSLSYSQGDGLMFEGTLEWEGASVKIKHSGHYSHSYSKEVTFYDQEGEEYDHTEADMKRFEEMYQSVCKKLEKAGYAEIEYQESEENFIEVCETNEYTFEADGTMRNA